MRGQRGTGHSRRDDGSRPSGYLPPQVIDLVRNWGLTMGEPYPRAQHYVCAVNCRDGTPAVLKLGVPGGAGLAREAASLSAFAGRGAVRLLRADLERGALLLERVMPGRCARELVPAHDSEAISVAVDVMRRLHRPAVPGTELPGVATQATALRDYAARYGDAGPLPLPLVLRAGELIGALCASATERVLLHGDLHHDNILRATREPWLAIDPHGLIGDPGYDVGTLLFNPDPANRDEALTALVPARVAQLAAELAMPAELVVAWGFVKAVLSEVWSVEDQDAAGRGFVPGRALDVAGVLAPGLP